MLVYAYIYIHIALSENTNLNLTVLLPPTQETLLLSREKKAHKLRLKDDKEKFAFEARSSV